MKTHPFPFKVVAFASELILRVSESEMRITFISIVWYTGGSKL